MHFNYASSMFMTLLAPWDALSHWLNALQGRKIVDLRVLRRTQTYVRTTPQ
jgi:hypothetical protein